MPIAVPAVAAAQDGLFTRAQARAEGWSRFRARRLLESGRWVSVIGSVLASAATPVSTDRLCRAGAMAAGGVVSHGSAGLLWGFPTVTQPDDRRVHVSVTAARNPRIDGVRVHRRPVPASEVTTLRGIPVTARRRTLVDCLGSLSKARATALLDHALAERWLDLSGLAHAVRESRARHGVQQLRALLEQASSGSRSEAERVLHRLLEGAGIGGWLGNEPLRLGHALVEADVWFPAERLVLEVDGKAWHVSPDRFQRDRVRQNALVLHGITVLRFTWADLTGAPGRVIREVNEALAELLCRSERETRRTGP